MTLPTPLHAPDFAQALGVQVSLLAKDGVEHAELHLNPADMGPVSVQIVMDGTQARIEFGADLAQTRHALEAGIPELASAQSKAGCGSATRTGAGCGSGAAACSSGEAGAATGVRRVGARLRDAEAICEARPYMREAKIV